MKPTLKHLLSGLSLGAVLFSGAAARAGDETMIKLLEVLHDNGTINDEAYGMLMEAAQAGPTEPNSTNAGGGDKSESQESETGTTVELKDSGLDIRETDSGARLRLGGRLHVDSARYNEDQVPLGDGSKVRRLRLEAKAKVASDWQAKASIDFADNEVDLKSTYIQYSAFENTDWSIGNFKEPFSLEELSSSNDMTFMERAMLTEFSPGRHIGVGFNHWRGKATLAAGLFGEGISDETEDDAGWGAAARFTYFPLYTGNHLLHLGAALAYREPGDNDTFRLRARPESGVTDVRLVNTSTISGVEDVTRLGLGAAAGWGPFSLQGEYAAANVTRGGGAGDLTFWSWYAYASWILTGERRTYKPGDGEMGGVTPKYSLGSGGVGAWELAARFSTIDLTDGDVTGGAQDNLTLGLNWYVTPNIRFMLNYVDVLDVDNPGSIEDGDEPQIIQIRAQFNY